MSGELHAPAVLLAGEESPIHIEQEAAYAAEPIWTLSRRETPPLAPAGNRSMIPWFSSLFSLVHSMVINCLVLRQVHSLF